MTKINKASRNKNTILRLRVPKQNESGPVAFEQILASLHGLISREIKNIGEESVSFEIAQINGEIYFYVVVPSHLRTSLSSQFYAQYPGVEIEIVPEYFTKKLVKNKQVISAKLQSKESWVFPFKRYTQFEDSSSGKFEDPLNSITSALAHLPNKTDSAIIQITVSPVSKEWNYHAKKTLRRFFQSGAWQWKFFRDWYQWARLHPDQGKRLIRNPVRWGLLFFAGIFRGNSLNNSLISRDNQDSEIDEKTASKSHDNESVYGAAFDKISRLAFATNIRVAYIHSDKDKMHAEAKLRELVGVFEQFSLPQLNHFATSQTEYGIKSKTFREIVRREINDSFILSQEEVATFYHLPTLSVSTPRISWVDSPTLEPPLNLPDDTEKEITLIGETNFRDQINKYGLKTDDRRRHVYVIGKTGMGKSTLMENMIFSDILAGKGVAVIDPHGDLADAVLRFVPKSRTNDVVLFDPADREFPIAFNLLEGKNQAQRNMIASGLIGVIKKLNINSWGPRLEHFLRNTILALVEAPDTTMLGITRMLVDDKYRAKILKYVKDPMVLSFWGTEFAALSPSKRAEAIGPIQNKVGQFLATPLIRNIVGQPKSTLDLRFAMDTGKIVIVNLSKGKLGEDNSAMLGSLLITKFQLDAMSRADTPEKDRKDFYLYVDEFQNFATDSFATILSEARKYRLNLTMANQYIAQMSEEVAAAVFGNVGSLISFQVGIDDAKVLAEQFDEDLTSVIDIASLPKYQVYNRIMVDGLTSPVFSGKTLPPPEIDDNEDPEERAKKIRNFSRQRYSTPREKVEDKIMRWAKATDKKPKENKGKKK